MSNKNNDLKIVFLWPSERFYGLVNSSARPTSNRSQNAILGFLVACRICQVFFQLVSSKAQPRPTPRIFSLVYRRYIDLAVNIHIILCMTCCTYDQGMLIIHSWSRGDRRAGLRQVRQRSGRAAEPKRGERDSRLYFAGG